jgi:F420-non-reducing hydrogenase small subunit
VLAAVTAILEGKLPPKGAILSPNKSLCASCKRNETKPEDIAIPEVKRLIDVQADPDTCFLAQGILCMGPATRDGCGEPCINGNMPCTGCFGPTDASRDQGGKMIATLGGILQGDDDSSADKALEGIVDPAGTFYRYSVSGSFLGHERKEEN